MSLWKLQRVPEPEEMDDAAEVASYSSAAAERHLSAIDDTFVDHLFRLLRKVPGRGLRGLDVGSGPAQIPVQILLRHPAIKVVALDRSLNMLVTAREHGASVGIEKRLLPLRADGQQLPFADGTFDFILCNSVLHHARAPEQLLRELFRVAAPGGAVLVRDLRRPARPLLRWHLWRHGRRYSGLMRTLFDHSVRAAYTVDELQEFLHESGLSPTARRFGRAHVVIERPAR